MDALSIMFLTLLGGLGPTLVWLWFWLRQDKTDPEPINTLLITFVAGMCVVPLAYPLEYVAKTLWGGSLVMLFLSWATIEEGLKIVAAYIGGLTSRAMDGPFDAVIYLVTAALGFAALENMLFLYTPLLEGNLEAAIITTNMRFVGANLLHVVASAFIGVGIGLTYYRSWCWRILSIFVGVITAIGLHAAFNFFIIQAGTARMISIFAFVWLSIIFLIFILQHIKHLKRTHELSH